VIDLLNQMMQHFNQSCILFSTSTEHTNVWMHTHNTHALKTSYVNVCASLYGLWAFICK